LEAWYLTAEKKNQMLATTADAKITDAFNSAAFNFLPESGSPVIDASYWFTTSVKALDLSNETNLVNYPNPFSGSTTIELQVKNETYTKVVVVNMAGQLVANLQDGILYEGDYRFTFDGTNLPKGLYVAKVITNNSQKSVKMISK
ncbi:MAG: T9SS type A sorting domain-containing protein, partial [Prolixibacteraceae bacterium]